MLAASALVLGALLATLAPARPAGAAHGAFQVSSGIYRIPYADGTQLRVTNDHHNHGGFPGNDRIDMQADVPAPGTVVAGASGTIRAIVDIHGTDNGLGDGLDINGNAGVVIGGNPHVDAREHSCNDSEDANFNQQLDAGEDLDGDGAIDGTVANLRVPGTCQSYNNYVWIEHPNGEWTKYTHLATRSVTGAPNSWSVGDTILVGQVLGIESDVGRATGSAGCMGPPSTVGCGRHLHHEVAVRNDASDDTPYNDGTFIPYAGFGLGNLPGGGNQAPGAGPNDPATGYYAGGFIQGTNRPPLVCDIAGNLYVDNTTSPGNNAYIAGPCTNSAPTAEAGGPYSVDEGSTVPLDGTGSTDPENAVLTFSWSPGANLDDPTGPTPIYSGIDDTVDAIELTVSDVGGDVSLATALTDTDEAIVTVMNVPPTVTPDGDAIAEGGTATVTATFTDPGTLDTHTASINWGDGTLPQAVTLAQLGAGVQHVYGDNGSFPATVTVTDDNGGAGAEAAPVHVSNLAPVVSLDVPGMIAFPGGDYAVVEAGGEIPASAEGTDAGSDDLTFAWSVGQETTYFNGLGPDPSPSPFGTFPFAASDDIGAGYATPGSELLTVTLTDDDGGADGGQAGVIVTGIAEATKSLGWWKHQYSGAGNSALDPDTAAGYLDAVNAVSSVFSEEVTATTPAHVHGILSPTAGDRRARATGALMAAWLQFTSGAVASDAIVPLSGGSSVDFLDLMFAAEETILDVAASDAELHAVERDLERVRHAG